MFNNIDVSVNISNAIKTKCCVPLKLRVYLLCLLFWYTFCLRYINKYRKKVHLLVTV